MPKPNYETLRVIDTAATTHIPTSRFINKEEYAEIFPKSEYPFEVLRQKTFVFHNRRAIETRRELALHLIQKYPSVKIVDEKGDLITIKENDQILSIRDDLDLMKWGDLVKLCFRMNISSAGKKPEVLQRIREARLAGVKALTDLELEQRKLAREEERKQGELNPPTEPSAEATISRDSENVTRNSSSGPEVTSSPEEPKP